MNQDVGAIPVIVNHLLQSANLPFDSFQAFQIRYFDIRIDSDRFTASLRCSHELSIPRTPITIQLRLRSKPTHQVYRSCSTPDHMLAWEEVLSIQQRRSPDWWSRESDMYPASQWSRFSLVGYKSARRQDSKQVSSTTRAVAFIGRAESLPYVESISDRILGTVMMDYV